MRERGRRAEQGEGDRERERRGNDHEGVQEGVRRRQREKGWRQWLDWVGQQRWWLGCEREKKREKEKERVLL